MEKVLNIFVYGTLKRGERNFYVLQDRENGFAKFQVEGKTKEKFPLVVGKSNQGDGHSFRQFVYKFWFSDATSKGKVNVLAMQINIWEEF